MNKKSLILSISAAAIIFAGCMPNASSDSEPSSADKEVTTETTAEITTTALPIVPVTTTTTVPETTVAETTVPEAEHCIYEPEGFEFSGKIYIVGDSTASDYDEKVTNELGKFGWGMQLGDNFDDVEVIDLALPGRSSRSFIAEENYQTLCSSIGSGDYVFIQFGHNDQKLDEQAHPGKGTLPMLDMETLDDTGKNADGLYSYEWILLNKYIKVAEEKGAVPVLLTPITRRNPDGTPNYSAHTGYEEGVLTLGRENNVAVIDMTALTKELYDELYAQGGADETAKLHCYIDAEHTKIDNTHLSEEGAAKVAAIIAEEADKLGFSLGANYKKQ